MPIMSYNGGAIMAMKGKNCAAIAADRHFGIQAQMVTTDFQEIFPMGGWLYIGLAGLATDVQTVAQCLKFRLNLYALKEGQQIKPYTFTSMVASLLYEKHFGPCYTDHHPHHQEGQNHHEDTEGPNGLTLFPEHKTFFFFEINSISLKKKKKRERKKEKERKMLGRC
uniref:Proteasome component C10-II n=1 Tax=Pongo abelii TaxID=9601 RepID=A0A8I5SXT5_PONAB